MTIHSFMNRWAQLFTWLYYHHQWQTWEVLAVAGVALLLLIWAIRKRRSENEARARAMAHPIHQNPPIIGARLAARSISPVAVTTPKRHRLAFISGNKDSQTSAAEPSVGAVADARRPQDEAAKSQTQANLQRRLDELKTTSEKLQSQNNQGKQIEQRLRRRTAKLLAAGKKLRQEISKLEKSEELLRKQADQAAAGQRFSDGIAQSIQPRKRPSWSPLELLAPGRLARGHVNPQGQAEPFAMDTKRPADSRRASEPLDVERLKAIAALARRIQSRPKRA